MVFVQIVDVLAGDDIDFGVPLMVEGVQFRKLFFLLLAAKMMTIQSLARNLSLSLMKTTDC